MRTERGARRGGRRVDEGPGDGESLLLPGREPAHATAADVTHAHRLEQFLRPAPGQSGVDPRQRALQKHVLDGVEPGK